MRYKVAVALHRAYPVPEDPLYLPIQAGAALGDQLPMQGDDSGDSISGKNALYCELTAHYWLWRNAEADVCGLCHYRRYFALRRTGGKQGRILTLAQAERLLETVDVIVPRPRIYLIETNYTQYAHAHRATDLDAARQAIAEKRPDFLPAFDRVMRKRWGRRFNMCIMKRAQFDAYSAWLFDILFTVEVRQGLSCEDPQHARTLGYLAERLMDVWLLQTSPRMRQLPVVHLEGQQWPRRIAVFLGRWLQARTKR